MKNYTVSAHSTKIVSAPPPAPHQQLKIFFLLLDNVTE
jgi:hypothetical protein